MDLVSFLGDRSFPRVKELLKEHRFSVKESQLHPNLYLITYHLLQGIDWNASWTRQCRGTILEKGTNKIVCLPFEKFFNAGEPFASVIDWTTAQVQEKVDGSLIKVYYYGQGKEGKWVIATNGTIDAREAANQKDGDEEKESGEDGDGFSNRNFYNLFFDCVASTLSLDSICQDDFTSLLDPNFTYLFEMLHPATQVVVPVQKPLLYHLATRDNQSHKELNDVLVQGISKPRLFPYLKSLDGCKTLLQETYLVSDDGEGFVVVDALYRRVKIKSQAYFLEHRKKSTKPNLVLTVLDGEFSEILAYFPHLKDELEAKTKAIEQIKSDFVIACKRISVFFQHEILAKKSSTSLEQKLLQKNLFLSLTGDDDKQIVHFKIKSLALEWAKSQRLVEKAVSQSDKESLLCDLSNVQGMETFCLQWIRSMSDSKPFMILLEHYTKKLNKK